MNQRPFDPQSNALPNCATPRARWHSIGTEPGPDPDLKRVTGIEPALGAWKAPVQPVHLTRDLRPVRLYERPEAESARRQRGN